MNETKSRAADMRRSRSKAADSGLVSFRRNVSPEVRAKLNQHWAAVIKYVNKKG